MLSVVSGVEERLTAAHRAKLAYINFLNNAALFLSSDAFQPPSQFLNGIFIGATAN